jgi:hypothetical protein
MFTPPELSVVVTHLRVSMNEIFDEEAPWRRKSGLLAQPISKCNRSAVSARCGAVAQTRHPAQEVVVAPARAVVVIQHPPVPNFASIGNVHSREAVPAFIFPWHRGCYMVL